MNHFLIASSQVDTAHTIGFWIGVGIAALIMISSPVCLIWMLVKFFKTKRLSWLFGALVTGAPAILFVFAFCYGVIKGVVDMQDYVADEQDIPTSRDYLVQESDLSVKIPEHWKLLQSLNETAVFQAGNPIREEYLIIIKYSKIDFEGEVLHLAEILNNELSMAVYDASISDMESLVVDGMTGYQTELSGVIDNTRISYLNTIIEGRNDYYQLLGWTLKSKVDSAFPVIREFVDSVAEKPEIFQ